MWLNARRRTRPSCRPARANALMQASSSGSRKSKAPVPLICACIFFSRPSSAMSFADAACTTRAARRSGPSVITDVIAHHRRYARPATHMPMMAVSCECPLRTSPVVAEIRVRNRRCPGKLSCHGRKTTGQSRSRCGKWLSCDRFAHTSLFLLSSGRRRHFDRSIVAMTMT